MMSLRVNRCKRFVSRSRLVRVLDTFLLTPFVKTLELTTLSTEHTTHNTQQRTDNREYTLGVFIIFTVTPR